MTPPSNGKNASASVTVRTHAEGLAAAGKGSGPAPVHLWNPPYCGEIDIRIARDGTWFHEGTPIGRPALVRLFANILKVEEGRHFLVTPAEKVGITVEDLPFRAVDFAVESPGPVQTVTFTTDVGDKAAAGPDNPIRVETAPDGTPAPAVHIRRGLWARIDRKSFYRLAEIAENRDGMMGVASQGTFFPLGPAD
jgi:hypothetical protein